MKRTAMAFFLLVFFFLLCSPACGPREKVVVGSGFDENAECISSSESPHFDYYCTIDVNGLPPEGGGISLVYNVEILLKEPDKIYKNVGANECFVPRSGDYYMAASGKDQDLIKHPNFPDIAIFLAAVF